MPFSRSMLRRLGLASLMLIPDPRVRARAAQISALVGVSERIPGWTRGREAFELARASYLLPGDPVIVEVGCFLGSSTVLLAGARRLKASGHVHAIDPFDASGDAFSESHYRRIAGQLRCSLRQRFEDNMRQAEVRDLVTVHEGTAESVGAHWSGAVDLLFLDGDHSPAGARAAFRIWTPFVRPGGIVALHNSARRHYAEGHDGFRRLALADLRGPHYHEPRCIGTTTFAVKR